MDWVAIQEAMYWLCFTGVNDYVFEAVKNNSYVLGPAAIMFYFWFQAHAKKTAATWDDKAAAMIKDKFGHLFGGSDDHEPEPKPEPKV